MKRVNSSTPSPEEMRAIIVGLTPAERCTLKDPNFITEDEADLIMSDRAVEEASETAAAEDLFAEISVPRTRPHS
ncbi:MAG TPA: hypothetical protein VHY84_07890 [Bryobacteraceae bacterium]|nr:hypothetical protein [Bryobacteraceae bacterium]